MSGTNSQTVQWSLTKGEVPQFIRLAKEYGIQVVGRIDRRQRPIRAVVQKPNNDERYNSFALSMRPHQRSDC